MAEDDKKLELDIGRLIGESENKRQAGLKLLIAGVDDDVIASKLNVQLGLIGKWKKFLANSPAKGILNIADNGEEEKKKGEEQKIRSEFDTSTIDRVHAILKNPAISKQDLAVDIVRKDMEVHRLQELLAGKGLKDNDGKIIGQQKSEVREGFVDPEMIELVKQMRRWQMQRQLVSDMIKTDNQNMGGDGNMDDRKYQALADKIEKMEKKDEMERLIGPIREKLDKLSEKRGSEIPPELKSEIDDLRKTLQKYDEAKKFSEIVQELQKTQGRSDSDALKYMEKLETMRSKFEADSKDKDRELQKERDEKLRMQIEGLAGDIEKKIKDMERKTESGKVTLEDIKSFGETVKTVKTLSKELGGEGKETSLADRVVESTLEGITKSIPEAIKTYRDVKLSNPYGPVETITLSPEEVEEIKVMRELGIKKKLVPSPEPPPIVESPVEVTEPHTPVVDSSSESSILDMVPQDTTYDKLKSAKTKPDAKPKRATKRK